MAYTPVELRHISLKKGFRGYRKDAVDQLLGEVAESFEDVWRERADLADKVESLESDLVRFRELEGLLRTTLVSAERAAAEMKEQARREADLILGEAHAEARKVQRDALGENERLIAESRRLRTAMRMALDSLDDAAPESEDAAPSGDGQNTWPGAREAA
jgi:cell division initiation protein